MTAAIWSAPPTAMMQFPIRFLGRFLQNHGLLQIFDRPQWRTIPGGAIRYLRALLHPLGDAVRTASTVTKVRRIGDGVQITTNDGEPELFDAAVLASHAPQSLAMLAEPTSLEQEILGSFQYQMNEAVLHFDEAMLPKRKACLGQLELPHLGKQRPAGNGDLRPEPPARSRDASASPANTQPNRTR